MNCLKTYKPAVKTKGKKIMKPLYKLLYKSLCTSLYIEQKLKENKKMKPPNC